MSIRKAQVDFFSPMTGNFFRRGTRRDDLLLDKDTQQRMLILRNHLADMKPVEAMEFLRKHMIHTQSNEEFLISMNG